VLRKERQLMSSLMSLGLSPSRAVEVISHPVSAAMRARGSEPTFDASDRQEGDKVLVWLNDMEKDQRYHDSSESCQKNTDHQHCS
jgi:UDP-glucose:glycoprotein glucosyltransferase